MAGAKQYKKAPIMIANEVAAKLEGSKVFEKVEAVAPGFLNLTLKNEFVKLTKTCTAEEAYNKLFSDHAMLNLESIKLACNDKYTIGEDSLKHGPGYFIKK